MLESVSDRQLRLWFNRINRHAFGGKLKNVELRFLNSTQWIARTHCYRQLKGERKEQHFGIDINRKIQFSNSLVVISLAHEMVHVEHWNWQHGERFQKRLLEVIFRAGLARFL